MKLAWPLRFGIFARIYLFGLLLLVSMAVAIAALVNAVIAPMDEAETLRVASWMVGQAQARAEVAQRQAFLDSLRAQAGIELALYDADGRLLAAGAEGAEVRLDAAVLERVRHDGRLFIPETNHVAVGVISDGRLAGVGVLRSLVEQRVDLGIAVLVGVMVALAVLAWPLARSLSVPIRRLSEAATRFGRGEMEQRSGLVRSDEIGELSRSFDEMADRIVALVRAEQLLVAGVAHELRSPLQRIRIATELACDGSDEAASLPPQHFEAMLEDMRELEEIITDVLTIARLETARAGASRELLKHREWFPAETLLRECALKLEMHRPQRLLELDLQQPLPDICIERRLMAMAVGNLLDNADKYSPAETPICLQARADAGSLRIEVSDRGSGIAPEHLCEVFRPFYRTDAARTRSAGGAGLGLAIVKGVVEAHDGSVSVHSIIGEGTRFCIELPCTVLPQAPDVQDR